MGDLIAWEKEGVKILTEKRCVRRNHAAPELFIAKKFGRAKEKGEKK